MTKNTKIVCDICKGEFDLTADCIEEVSVMLQHNEWAGEMALITFLTCPKCGKVYPVVIDTDQTTELLARLKEIQVRRFKRLSQNKPVPPRLEERYRALNRKLDFQRQQIAERFNGATYQLDGETYQLDYRYHAR